MNIVAEFRAKKYQIELPPRVQKKLDESHENLAKLERALEERERIMEPVPPQPGHEEPPQSAYMLHLIRENERLKKGQRGAQGGNSVDSVRFWVLILVPIFGPVFLIHLEMEVVKQ